MNVFFDGQNLHINHDGEDLPPIPLPGPHLVIFETTVAQTKCNPCDRCHNRQQGHAKVLPIRPETLCDPCKRKVELLEFITKED